MPDPSTIAPEDCPEPFWHETHRYCPACSWTERYDPEVDADHFRWSGVVLPYETGAYNDARLNERAIEVPIGQEWIRRQSGSGMEIGNVLAHYGPISHTVVDRYEKGRGIVNSDVLKLTTQADWILAISTLEHVRWDEPNKHPEGSKWAIDHLLSLLRPGGGMLVTVPFGWQPFLDSQILRGELGVGAECSFVRDGDGWVQTPEVEHRRYAASTKWAEAIWVGEWQR